MVRSWYIQSQGWLDRLFLCFSPLLFLRRIGLLPAAEASFSTSTKTPIMTKEKLHAQAEIKKSEITEDTILKVSKEVAIKFIEMGRVTPATFEQTFKTIHTTIKDTVAKG